MAAAERPGEVPGPARPDSTPEADCPACDLARAAEPALQLRRDEVPSLPAHGPPEGAGRAASLPAVAEPGMPSGRDFEDRPGRTGAAAFVETYTGSAVESRAAASKAERPQVIVDRLDVLVREPAPSPAAARPAADPGRMLRARYLRRL
jgi:hypothetical protein